MIYFHLSRRLSMVEGQDGSEGRQFEIKGFQFSEIFKSDVTKLQGSLFLSSFRMEHL